MCAMDEQASEGDSVDSVKSIIVGKGARHGYAKARGSTMPICIIELLKV